AVVPLGPPEQEASPHDFRERVEVAGRLGYSGVGLMHSDLMQIRRQYDWHTIRNILAESGMKYLELEFLVGWIAEGEEYARAEIVLDDMLTAAQALDVRHLKIGPDMQAKTWSMQHMIERFGGLCDKAAVHGTDVVLEPMPWCNVADLETAIAIVSGAARPNGGLLLDIWHLARGGVGYNEITTIPAGLVHYVEINDADVEIRGTLLEDTLNHRRFCGHGALDVSAFLKSVLDQGYDGPFGIEIISEFERNRPFAEVAADAIRTAQNEFAKVGK
ncbi:MAG: sugar phosphate isomerase/epimerase, partial [Pseudomonadota bacterium]|nr:sugar phosphate isomerase/epimerase [Pseudomonadota bacterium]